MSEFVGTIENVTETPVGSALDEDVTAGADSLTPADIEEFNPDGGTLRIGEESHNYTVDGASLELSGTLTGSYEEGEMIYLEPPRFERWAWVKEPTGTEALQVRVPHALWDRLPLGVRSEDDAEEVECELTIEGVAVISDVIAREPRIDASFTVPHTAPREIITDGEPPASSPTPVVREGIGSLVITWDAISNHDPVTYEVHVSTSSGFTPGPSTLYGEIRGTMLLLREYNDSPLVYGTTYYVKLIAKDEDGAAAPSTQASGSPKKVDGPDLEANSVATNHLDTDDLIANSAFIGGLEAEFAQIGRKLVIPDDEGQRLEQDIDGIRLYNSDDNLTANLSTQTGNAYMRGRVDFGQGSALLPGDTIELGDQAAGFETPELIRVEYRSGSGSNTGLAFGMPSGAPAGTVRIMVIRSVANTTHTLADFSGELASYWELVGSVNSADQGRLSMYVRTDDSTPTVLLPTVNFGASTDWRAQILEYVGLELEDEDVVNTASGSGTGISISTGTTTQTHELVLGALMVDASLFAVNPSGYTRVAHPHPLVYAKSVTTTGAQSLSATQFFAAPWLGILATFKCRAATGAPVAPDSGIRLYSADERPAFIDSNEDGGELALVSEIPTIAKGTATAPTSGQNSASVNVNHGLGVTPSTVVATTQNGLSIVRIDSRNSTQFQATVYHREGGSNTLASNVNFDWIALP